MFGPTHLCIPLNKCTDHGTSAGHPQAISEVHFPRHSLTRREQVHTTHLLNQNPKRHSVTIPTWLCCPVSIPHCTAESEQYGFGDGLRQICLAPSWIFIHASCNEWQTSTTLSSAVPKQQRFRPLDTLKMKEISADDTTCQCDL